MNADNFVNISGGNVQGFIHETHGTVNQNFIYQVSEAIAGEATGAEKLTQREYRQRQVLLSKVKEYWIEGVLKKSLYTQGMIELGLEKRSDAVKRPFSGFGELPGESRQILPTGTDATEVFNQMGEGRTLLILGEPGAGKTITLLTIAQNLITLTQRDLSRLIPVVLNLSSWGSRRPTIVDWLLEELWHKYQVPKEIGKGWVKNQQLALLLDGLDEVNVNQREACVQAINQFMQEHGQTEMVVCSRIADYEALSHRLQLRGAICLRSLTTEQVNQYFDAAGKQLEAVKSLLVEDSKLQELAKSPLTLSVITLAYQGKEVEELPQTGSVEARSEHLFNAYIERMLQRKRVNHQYSKHQTIHWLTWLAQKMFQASQSDFLIEEMQPNCLPSEKDKIIYRIVTSLILGVLLGLVAGIYFIYFDITFKNNQPISLINILISIVIGVLSGIIPGLIAGLPLLSSNRLIKGLISGTIFAIFITFFRCFILGQNDIPPILLSGILGGAIFSSIDTKIKPIESIEWDLNKMFKYVTFFCIIGIIYALIRSQSKLDSYSLYEIIVFILVGVFIGGFRIRKNSIDPKQAKPNEGIQRSLRYTVITFFFLVFIAMFVCWVMDFKAKAFNPVLISIGLAVGLLGALGANESSGVVCIQHFTLRLILHRNNYIPWNYAGFLDYATERIFLQKVGSSYIFVHRMLLEHFATRIHPIKR
ncbi:NACHT domain-containing protein [Dolichospermum planctonicum CS-1226]|uniref:NACHT domain-containing protein n=1 Tax=Dolichospermum planctonicum CS-1226 TaxID=3021751 RepID=A0ABT5AHZ9_9CYAN|nr:NACHT domain-containing protein [Dolichospermum planctonicum]MDB9536499.1 NACHT domain-containing protein [Dolichospermum planctonicum CS-1226]